MFISIGNTSQYGGVAYHLKNPLLENYNAAIFMNTMQASSNIFKNEKQVDHNGDHVPLQCCQVLEKNITIFLIISYLQISKYNDTRNCC